MGIGRFSEGDRRRILKEVKFPAPRRRIVLAACVLASSMAFIDRRKSSRQAEQPSGVVAADLVPIGLVDLQLSNPATASAGISNR
jgi:hypothetical protein